MGHVPTLLKRRGDPGVFFFFEHNLIVYETYATILWLYLFCFILFS